MELSIKHCKLRLSERDTMLIQNLSEGIIDHCIVFYEGTYYFIVHGTPFGQVVINNILYNAQDIETLVRRKYEMTPKRKVSIQICTCYGGRITPYHSELSSVVSMVNNLYELYYELKTEFFRTYIDFSYVAIE